MKSTPALLESVLNTAELNARPSRPPDYESENRALLALAQHLADSPRTILQKLAEVAMEICRVGSAGVSLISKESGDFYWPAIAGALKPHIGGGTPRHFGPCGTVLDRNAMQLFTHPERCFPYLAPLTPPIEEALLTPFYIEGEAGGTVWLIAHDATRKFDAEDLRQIESLGRFAAAAHQVWAVLDGQLRQAGAMRDMNQSLLVSSVRQHELTEQAEKAESAAAHELTERKRAEHALRESEDRFRTLAANEQASRLEAEAANRAKDTFLATLSHELRTPLTAILGWAVLLRIHPGDEAAVEEASLTIERNARMQAQLIEDVLDVSRIVSGKLRLEMRPSELSKIIQEAVASVQPAADAKDILIKVEIITGASPIVCDAARIQQVIWNLLSNAIKFSPKTGDIEVIIERITSTTRITITDQGEGISPDFLPHVFERFRQSDGTSTRKHGGLGLGLSIVRHLVELHGGTVDVQSEGLGQGATFIINLPIPAVSDSTTGGEERAGAGGLTLPTPGDAAAHATVRLDGLRVLVVDDEPDARNVIKATLEYAGAIVAAADSAAAALKLLVTVHPQVIVSDISMPAQDGYEFMREIRSMGAGFGGRELPAIALTAYARTEDRRRALLAGFQMHVAKPIDPQELAEVVASLAGRTGLD